MYRLEGYKIKGTSHRLAPAMRKYSSCSYPERARAGREKSLLNQHSRFEVLFEIFNILLDYLFKQGV